MHWLQTVQFSGKTYLSIRSERFASCNSTLATKERNAGSSTSLRFAQNDSREGGAPNFVLMFPDRINEMDFLRRIECRITLFCVHSDYFASNMQMPERADGKSARFGCEVEREAFGCADLRNRVRSW